MRYNAGFLLTTAILLSFIAQGHYHERPQQYGPIIPHLKTLFHRFCEIRNNQKLSREEADEQIDQMIMEEATEQLSWAYHTFKIEREKRNKNFLKRHAKWLRRLTDEAFKLDADIQTVRQNTNISYAEECRQVNTLKVKAPEYVRREMQLRMEDCREFTYPIRPQLARNRCHSEWSKFPIYFGVKEPTNKK